MKRPREICKMKYLCYKLLYVIRYLQKRKNESKNKKKKKKRTKERKKEYGLFLYFGFVLFLLIVNQHSLGIKFKAKL